MIYLLTGPNKHYKERYISALRKKYRDFSIHSFHCDDDEGNTLEQLRETLSQISLFDSSQKLVILYDYTKGDFLEDLYDILSHYGESKDTILILETGESLRSNARVYKYVDKKNILVAASYDNAALLKLVIERLKKGGVSKPEAIAQLLITTVEPDPFYLENEVDKIILYAQAHEGEELGSLNSLITKSMNNTIWDYLKNITYGDKYKAISIATTMLDHGENEYAMLAMILWNLKLISVVKASVSKSDEQIARDFGYSPYSVKNARAVVARFSYAKISLLYEKIVDLDYKIKSGVMDPQFGIILLSYIF